MKKINKIQLFLYGVILISGITLTILILNKKQTFRKGVVNELNGTVFDPSNFIKQPYQFQKTRLLLALSTDCNYCTGILEYMEMNKKTIFKKFQVIVAFNDSLTNIQQFCEQNKPIFDAGIEVYNDKQRRLLNYLQIKSYPSIFVLDNNTITEEGSGLQNIIAILEK